MQVNRTNKLQDIMQNEIDYLENCVDHPFGELAIYFQYSVENLTLASNCSSSLIKCNRLHKINRVCRTLLNIAAINIKILYSTM